MVRIKLAWIWHVATHSKCSMLAFPILANHLVRNCVRNFVVKLTFPFFSLDPVWLHLSLFLVHPNSATVQVLLIAKSLSLATQLLKTRVFFINWLFPSPLLRSHLPSHSNPDLWWTAFWLQIHVPSPSSAIPHLSPSLQSSHIGLLSASGRYQTSTPLGLCYFSLGFPYLSGFTNII